ncbi:hypothetical protein P7C73_g4960, partial [Tremellales sp. Uapishka_1]
MSSPSLRYDQAPSTDAEWEVALRYYGGDRDVQPGPSRSASLPLTERTQTPPDDLDIPLCDSPSILASRPLIHHEHSTESVETQPSKTTVEDSFYLEDTLPRASDKGKQTSPGATEGETTKTVQNHDDSASRIHRDSIEGLGIKLSGDSQGERSGEMERGRLRKEWETQGWLPGPEPTPSTKERRRKALRRLGLAGNGEGESEQERRAIMAKYTELARQIFDVDNCHVSILRDEKEILYSLDTETLPRTVDVTEAVCSHAIVSPIERCTVVRNLKKDWRFRRNPMTVNNVWKFYAGAPLRYHRPGKLPIDFGTLCLWHTEERNDFTSREQGILMKLANMLVYQLATYHSQITAKRSAAMHEASIDFIRRSVLPDPAQDQPLNIRKPSKAGSRSLGNRAEGTSKSRASQWSRPGHRRLGARGSFSSVSDDGVGLDQALSRGASPRVVVKTGPRESAEYKMRAEKSDRVLYTDAAKTLRKYVQADAVAIVSMEEYQLFIRRSSRGSESPGKSNLPQSKENIIRDFLQGKEWPSDVEPVVNHVQGSRPIQILGLDGGSAVHNNGFNFWATGVEKTIQNYLKTYLTKRQVWWDREDPENELACQVMKLVPVESQTTLAMACMGPDGKIRYTIFASWNRPPSTLGDLSSVALPFANILMGSINASLAIRKIRELERSQISYSNLQAHELRTPMHQILAMTQLLRAAMLDLAETPKQPSVSTTTEQIRDLMPFLDAIDTSGKTLHGIVDNILSFLDLKGRDNVIDAETPGLVSTLVGAPRSLEVLFEEMIEEACVEDKKSREANGLPLSKIETIFEIIPPFLGEQVTEDASGAIRKALAKILANAYKFIEGEGCVEIYVDDVPSLLPPEGYEDISLMKRISIRISDSGRGMEPKFVRDKLGEPWAKEDPYATGSGLSVHLAYRIIDLLGGKMEMESAPGQGCSVQIEVPVPRRHLSKSESSEPDNGGSFDLSGSGSPHELAQKPDDINVGRKVHLAGFVQTDAPGSAGLARLGTCLKRQFTKLGCEIVAVDDADLVVADGTVEKDERNAEWLKAIKASDIVFLVAEDHHAHPTLKSLEEEERKSVRRFRKPATPSILRETLFPGHAKDIQSEVNTPSGTIVTDVNAPEAVDHRGRTVQGSDQPRSQLAGNALRRFSEQGAALHEKWKPRGVPLEEAVAALSLGDYFSSTRPSILRSISSASTASPGDVAASADSTPTATPVAAPLPIFQDHANVAELENATVLVVEDNLINRKILVKILSSKKIYHVLEAEDGIDAVEKFRELQFPVIVLLDINIPDLLHGGFNQLSVYATPTDGPPQFIDHTNSDMEWSHHGQMNQTMRRLFHRWCRANYDKRYSYHHFRFVDSKKTELDDDNTPEDLALDSGSIHFIHVYWEIHEDDGFE